MTALGRPKCRRCGHFRHLGKCRTVSVFPPAVADRAPAHAAPADRDHLEGTLLADCDCEGTLT